MATEPARSDFQPKVEVARYFDRSPVSLPRLLLRLAVLVAVLVAFDVWVSRSVVGSYGGSYRLPLELPTAALPGYVHALDRRAGSPSASVVFLGASPTWGYRTKDSASTFPYAYAAAASQAGFDVASANLAANGLLVGDQYLLAQRVAGDADVVFVQLTYHMFDPGYENGRLVRYPEIAQLPGVRVSSADARLLGVPRKSESPVAAPVSAALFDTWAAYRERNAVATKLFGGMPEDRLKARWDRAVRRTRGATATPDAAGATEAAPGAAPDASSADAFGSFDSLDPDQQSVVIARYAENSSFTVSPNAPQVRTLRALVDELRRQNARAVFFVAPLNRDIVDYYALIDRTQYLANSKAIGDAVRSGGFPYIDYNAAEAPAFSADLFADIDHTTDAGSRAVGERLFEDTRDYLRTAIGAASAGAEPGGAK